MNSELEYIKPQQYNEKINILDNRMNTILEEFKKLYVISKMYPTNSEYQQQFQNIVSNINEIQLKTVSMSTDIQTNTNNLNKKLEIINNSIKKERDENNKLKKKMGIIENKSNASNELIDDYKKMYDQTYLRNWALGLSIIICLYNINNIFKSNIV